MLLCYGEIQKFIQVSSNNPPLAIIKISNNSNYWPTTPSIRKYNCRQSTVTNFDNYLTYTEGSIRCIYVSSIVVKCFYLSNDNWNVLTLPVNDIENE